MDGWMNIMLEKEQILNLGNWRFRCCTCFLAVFLMKNSCLFEKQHLWFQQPTVVSKLICVGWMTLRSLCPDSASLINGCWLKQHLKRATIKFHILDSQLFPSWTVHEFSQAASSHADIDSETRKQVNKWNKCRCLLEIKEFWASCLQHFQ